jgi:hypothetical protein
MLALVNRLTTCNETALTTALHTILVTKKLNNGNKKCNILQNTCITVLSASKLVRLEV